MVERMFLNLGVLHVLVCTVLLQLLTIEPDITSLRVLPCNMLDLINTHNPVLFGEIRFGGLYCLLWEMFCLRS